MLKPDAARDCLFTADDHLHLHPERRTCVFHNGHPLTSSDVKFSIERATRLDVAGSSASLLSIAAADRDPGRLTVRFVLSRVDTQFGWALASPAASIVDEEVYDADEVARTDQTRSSAPARSRWPSFADEQLHLQPVRDLRRSYPGAGWTRAGLPHRPGLGRRSRTP